VIAGAGVIGTSTAYYLSKLAATNQHYTAASPLRITLVDITGRIAPAASGKAGGFLALNWNDYSPVGKLARRSFALHEHLASSDELGSESIMYRRLTSASISIAERSERGQHTLMKKPSGKKLEGIEWVHPSNNHNLNNPTDNAELVTQTVTNNYPSSDIDVVGIQILGDESTIAQVHPKMLCDSMWEAIQKNPHVKSNLIKGQIVDSVHDNEDGSLIGAKLLDDTILDADAILYECGPWTKQGNCMLGVKYHSVIIPTSKVLNQSVFFDGLGDPEVYPRPDSTAYCTGFPDDAITVTERPGEEEVRDEAVNRIVATLRKASGGTNGALGKDPELKQSCYLPTTLDGVPIIGPKSNKKNCFIAAGHGCWGILLGPATGEAMASLLVNGCSTKYVDLSLFRPDRFSI
jgi:glycine/D-amino acid oxidase-like deaminating enzyme